MQGMKGRRAPQLALLLSLAGAARLAAQSPPPPRFEAVVDAGVTTNAADGFSENQICATGTAGSLGARAHARLGRWIAFEASGQLFAALATQQCVDGLLPPPPPTGPFTLRYGFYDSRIIGYPFASTDLRVLLVPLHGAGSELRAWGGVSRLWAKRITVPHAGVTAVLGHHRVRTLLELDTWWYRVPRHQVTENYQDGVLISSQDRVIRVHARTFVFRAGAAIPLGRP
jgi:hypothetical protein